MHWLLEQLPHLMGINIFFQLYIESALNYYRVVRPMDPLYVHLGLCWELLVLESFLRLSTL